jgi:hypothetical protein
MQVADLAKCLDELDRFMVVVEDELAAGDAAIHVVGGSRDKQARVSRHEIAPMRGRDTQILHGTHHITTMVQW